MTNSGEDSSGFELRVEAITLESFLQQHLIDEPSNPITVEGFFYG